jgi:hypothetical protein
LGFVAKVHGDVLCGHLPEFPLAPLQPLIIGDDAS